MIEWQTRKWELRVLFIDWSSLVIQYRVPHCLVQALLGCCRLVWGYDVSLFLSQNTRQNDTIGDGCNIFDTVPDGLGASAK
jgi:hypothetical protein